MCVSPWAVLWKQSTFQSSWAHNWAGTSAPPRFRCLHHFPLWSLAFQTFGGIHPGWPWKCSWSVCGSHSLPGRQRMQWAGLRDAQITDEKSYTTLAVKTVLSAGPESHCTWFTDHRWNWMKAWEAHRGSSPLEATANTTFKCPQLCPPALTPTFWAPPVRRVRGGLGGIISLTLYHGKKIKPLLSAGLCYFLFPPVHVEEIWYLSLQCTWALLCSLI